MITEEDIAKRLFRRCPFWFQGPPVVIILPPDDGSFGILKFKFPDPDLEDVDFKFLYSHAEIVKNKAELAVKNFKVIMKQWHSED